MCWIVWTQPLSKTRVGRDEGLLSQRSSRRVDPLPQRNSPTQSDPPSRLQLVLQTQVFRAMEYRVASLLLALLLWTTRFCQTYGQYSTSAEVLLEPLITELLLLPMSTSILTSSAVEQENSAVLSLVVTSMPLIAASELPPTSSAITPTSILPAVLTPTPTPLPPLSSIVPTTSLAEATSELETAISRLLITVESASPSPPSPSLEVQLSSSTAVSQRATETPSPSTSLQTTVATATSVTSSTAPTATSSSSTAPTATSSSSTAPTATSSSSTAPTATSVTSSTAPTATSSSSTAPTATSVTSTAVTATSVTSTAATATDVVGSGSFSQSVSPADSTAMVISSVISSVVPSMMPSGEGEDTILDKITNFFRNDVNDPLILTGVILGPVVVLLLVVLACLGCCCLRSCYKKRRKRFDLDNQMTTPANGINTSYRSRSRTSFQEMKHIEGEPNAFYSEFHYRSASQPHHSTVQGDSIFHDPLPSISPLSYPSQLKNYMTSPDRGDLAPPRIPLSGSPGELRRFPGSSPSLHRPTPLGQQLQKQAGRGSAQGSRNSIQGSRASISALGSKTSFSGSRNSFLSSNNTMSRDEMRNSGSFLTGHRTMSEEEASGSQQSFRPLIKQTSLDMVPTRESPVQLPARFTEGGTDLVSLTCISNPVALQGEEGGREGEGREDGDGVDENDLRKDPLFPVMASTPANQGAEDLPTKEERQQQMVDGSRKTNESLDSAAFASSQRKGNKNLRMLTSLSTGKEEDEGESTVSELEASSSSVGTAVGRRDGGNARSAGNGRREKDSNKPGAEKPRSKPMSRLEKLTSLDYLRSSIRRSLKKKRVSFLSRTPDSTPKAKKKTPPRTLPEVEPDFEPDPLTFSNQGAFDTEEPAISPRIHTPSPLSPDFEAVDEYPQRYADDFYHPDIHPDIYPETHPLRHPYPGRGGGAAGTRMRGYSDMPMFAPQLSQPTYYQSAPHYPQPSYPQLSQQYIPQSYAQPQPPQQQQPSFMVSPVHRSLGGGPMAPLQQHQLHPSAHSSEYYGRRYTDSVVGGSGSRGRPVLGNRENSAPGQNRERLSTDSRSRENQARSPDAYTDTSNVSGQYDRAQSPDRFTETSVISDIRAQSPDIYTSLQAHDSYLDAPHRFRAILTSPDDRPSSPQYQAGHPSSPQYQAGHPSSPQYQAGHPSSLQYQAGHPSSPQYQAGHPMQGAVGRYGERPVKTQPNSHYTERSMESQPTGSSYRRNSIDNQPGHYRERSIDGPTTGGGGGGQGRRSSIDNQPPSASRGRRSSIEIASHIRPSSIDNQPPVAGNYARHSIDNQPPSAGHSRRSSIDNQPPSAGHSRRSSIDNQPPVAGNYARHSTDNQPPSAGHSRRSSIDNQPPVAGNYARHSIDNQPPSAGHSRRSSIDNHPQSAGNFRRTSAENHPGAQYRERTGFQPILEPGPYQNRMEVGGGWQHSQREEQYGMGPQHHQYGGTGAPGWGHEGMGDVGRSPEPMERPVDSGTNTAKAKVSWNNEIIEHLRTPSDSSDHYDL